MAKYENMTKSKLSWPVKTNIIKSRNIRNDHSKEIHYNDNNPNQRSQLIYHNSSIHYKPILLAKDNKVHKKIHVSFDDTKITFYNPDSIIKPIVLKKPKMKIALKAHVWASQPDIKQLSIAPKIDLKFQPLKLIIQPQLKVSESTIQYIHTPEKHTIDTTKVLKADLLPLIRSSSVPLIITKNKVKKHYISPNQILLNRIYNEDHKIKKVLKEMKKDNSIALQKDFNLDKYQESLMSVIENNISLENIHILKDKFFNLNETIAQNSFRKQRITKWNILAKRIRKVAPPHLINKLNSLKC